MEIDTYDDFDGDDGQDPDMQDILAQIKDSEALAVQFSDSHKIASGSFSFPLSEDDDSSEVEILPDPSQFSPSMSGISRSAAKQTGKLRDNGAREDRPLTLVRPDEALGPFRDVFTRIRECTKCGELVKSPRGCVRAEGASIQILFKHDCHPGHILRNPPSTESRVLVARSMHFMWN